MCGLLDKYENGEYKKRCSKGCVKAYSRANRALLR